MSTCFVDLFGKYVTVVTGSIYVKREVVMYMFVLELLIFVDVSSLES